MLVIFTFKRKSLYAFVTLTGNCHDGSETVLNIFVILFLLGGDGDDFCFISYQKFQSAMRVVSGCKYNLFIIFYLYQSNI